MESQSPVTAFLPHVTGCPTGHVGAATPPQRPGGQQLPARHVFRPGLPALAPGQRGLPPGPYGLPPGPYGLPPGLYGLPPGPYGFGHAGEHCGLLHASIGVRLLPDRRGADAPLPGAILALRRDW
ncbi:MAG: hypothetical protein FJZ47_09870 [Candidatus Tectomicrobia bacterium]|uniref:Uncharacterized protein n=1 Tax=Tectimicrobiota bacterium TaxID=2528274 RepID=A0A937W2R4_UNCTE|nr:hypothetical protein [Candidatus Tectomicrobia bacterium]